MINRFFSCLALAFLTSACGEYVEVSYYDVYAVSEKYVTAEFSEVSLSMDLSPEIDSWTEKASDVYLVTTSNDTVSGFEGCSEEQLRKTAYGYYEANSFPIVYEDYSKQSDFDNYRKHDNLKLTLVTATDEIGITKELYQRLADYRKRGLPIWVHSFSNKIEFNPQISGR